jgi:CRISPR/Cas system CSM-associated protein Csm3 (group 7 of RAMP superfamily)
MEYRIYIHTESDVIFGNGQSVPGFIDSDILYDHQGFPYMNGKTFKGKLGEMAQLALHMIKGYGLSDKHQQGMNAAFKSLFGEAGSVLMGTLKFSDCELSEGLRNYLAAYQNQETGSITKDEVLEVLTYVDRQTAIDNSTGVAKKSSLRNFRVIKRGLVFECQVYAENSLNDYEKILLGFACRLLKHIGSQETKGKGLITTQLWLDEKDVTLAYVKGLDKVVNSYG